MVEDSYAYAEQDVNARLLIETQTEADTVINHVRRALTQGADLLSAEERSRIDAALRALSQARQGSERDLIRERTVAVNRATERLAEALMDRSLKAALTTKRADKILEQE